MTRREIIKSGLGLAGIIASGRAPAAIVKSLVGAKETGFSDDASEWENPYITDGLIHMFDGQWNTGEGLHKTNPNKWIDLGSAKCDANLEGSQSGDIFSSLAFECEAAWWRLTSQDVLNALDNGALTIEIVADLPSIQSPVWGRYYTALLACSSTGTVSSGVGFFYHTQTLRTLIKIRNRAAAGRSVSFGLSSISGSGNFYYINGTRGVSPLTTTITYGGKTVIIGSLGSSASVWPGKYNCIRFYSRALTANEVAYNYSIDKERFGV